MRRYLFLFVLFTLGLGLASAETNPRNVSRGISVASPHVDVTPLGYDWKKVYNVPTQPSTSNVLYRFDVDANDFYSGGAFTFGRLRGIASQYGDYIDAYEIGNEPNIISEWGSPPVAHQYVRVLCEAFNIIRQHDPSALVISAGLAPTGRIQGNYNGHLNHNVVAQDEREYLLEFIISGGHDCADAIGFHPIGYRADFDAAPDVTTGNPDTNCTEGFCFRTIEKFYQVLDDRGLGYKQIWATEMGWLREPPHHCLSHPSWEGRAWQIVSAGDQIQNIQGAFDYADANYPWLQNMFVFNYDFNKAPWYDDCEQMRYYSIDRQGVPEFYDLFLPIIEE